MSGLIVDLFCGGGGASAGIRGALGREVDIAINHSPVAIEVHERNHPTAEHYRASVWRVHPLTATRGRPVALLWASPDCRHFSNAKGGVPVKKNVRSLANVVVQWVKHCAPELVVVENVREFLTWGPLGRDNRPIKARAGELFRKWVRALERRGYSVEWRVLDASLYGAPTRRKRLFVVARRDGAPVAWPEPTHGDGRAPLRTAAECIDWSIPTVSIFGRKRSPKPLAYKTLRRIAYGIKRYVTDAAEPFIVKVNHGKDDHRTEGLDEPLTTVTAQRRGHAIVVPTLVQTGYGERPGQRPRVPGLHVPLGTCVDGQKHALVTAFLSKAYGDPDRAGGGGAVIGSELGKPVGTVTGRDHHGVVAATLVKFRGTSASHPGCESVDEPLSTISGGGGKGGGHHGAVAVTLCAYYGSDGTGGQSGGEPMRTVTSRDRLGLVTSRLSRGETEGSERVLAFLREHLGPDATNVVTIDGDTYVITDIGLRMLEPHELLRAQFGDYAEGYDLSPARTKAKKVWLVGNSVPPNLAEAVVAANTFGGEWSQAA